MCFPERPAGNRARWPRQLGYPLASDVAGARRYFALLGFRAADFDSLGGALGCFADRSTARQERR